MKILLPGSRRCHATSRETFPHAVNSRAPPTCLQLQFKTCARCIAAGGLFHRAPQCPPRHLHHLLPRLPATLPLRHLHHLLPRLPATLPASSLLQPAQALPLVPPCSLRLVFFSRSDILCFFFCYQLAIFLLLFVIIV